MQIRISNGESIIIKHSKNRMGVAKTITRHALPAYEDNTKSNLILTLNENVSIDYISTGDQQSIQEGELTVTSIGNAWVIYGSENDYKKAFEGEWLGKSADFPKNISIMGRVTGKGTTTPEEVYKRNQEKEAYIAEQQAKLPKQQYAYFVVKGDKLQALKRFVYFIKIPMQQADSITYLEQEAMRYVTREVGRLDNIEVHRIGEIPNYQPVLIQESRI